MKRFFIRVLVVLAFLSPCISTSLAQSTNLLTAREKAWLKNHGPIRFAPDPHFPPFEFFDQDGQLSGATPALLDMMAKNLNVSFVTVRYATWNDVLEGMRRGEADMLGTLTWSKERDEFLLFTQPYLEVPFVLFVRKDTPPSTTLTDISSGKLGVVENNGAHSWLSEHHPDIQPLLVSTVREGLMMLALERIDGLIETLPVGAQVISELSLNNLHVAGDVLSKQPQHLAVSKTNVMLLAILEKGLKSISSAEKDMIVRHWLGFENLRGEPDLPWWFKQILLASGLLVIFLLVSILVLRRVVRLRNSALQFSENRYRTLLENLPQMIFLKDVNSIYISCNEHYARLIGLKPAELPGKTDYDFYPKHLADKYRADDQEVMRSGLVRDIDEALETNGNKIIIHTVKTPVYDDDGNVRGVLGIFWDVTELKQHEAERERLEVQLRDSQKMEGIGQLAGGVAHDFNNILTVIMGNINLLESDKSLDAEGRALLHEIQQSADRASNLTRQLLTFSRRQAVHMTAIDVNNVLMRLKPILDPLARDLMVMQIDTTPDLPPVLADANMLEQIVINLAVNARDAMPTGGLLSIRTRVVEFDDVDCKINKNRKPGRYVVLEAEDNGHGMDDETKAHIFEPFFTTKSLGKGTGLGLATVYGVVQQHGGWIEVESALDHGSRFTIFFPTDPTLKKESSPLAPRIAVPGGAETILLVEDEASLRRVINLTLTRLGYRVHLASSGDEALVRWPAIADEVNLLLSDIVMPGSCSGIELAKQLIEQKPSLQVLLCSGYSDDHLIKNNALPPNTHFLAKPYEISTLANLIRSILGSVSTDRNETGA